MRKQTIHDAAQDSSDAKQQWLDLKDLARVEISSENPAHPIEAALTPGAGPGWRAEQPGQQTIRLLFDAPQRLKHIRLLFEGNDCQRTQEFVLRWSPDRSQHYREIVRQQYNFSPPATIEECEDYDVALDGVTGLELRIIPDVSGGPTYASLAELRLA